MQHWILLKDIYKQPIYKLLMIAVIIWFFVGRLVKKGLFGDGLLYASMSRNMAEGRGDIWHPYFSSSYWIEGLPTYYYENPPLMLWMQSLFFTIHGDHWWVEKWFCFWVLVVNMLAFRLLWKWLSSALNINSAHWPVLVLCWYLIPISVWGNVNNMMDTLLLTWCILSIALIIKGCLDRSWPYIFAGGITIFLGFLTKGPVALYPLVIPGILWLLKLKDDFGYASRYTLILLMTVVSLMILLLSLVPDAQEYFSFYWEQRLKAVITGSRSDDAVTGWAKVFTLRMVGLHTLGILFVGSITYLIRRKLGFTNHHKHWIVFFVLLGMASTLPIMISTKQSEIYLIPGLPMMAFALAIYLSPLVSKYEIIIRRPEVIQFLIVTIIMGVVWCVYHFGSYRRDADLIRDIEKLESTIGSGHQIGVDSFKMKNFIYHTYMQRIGKFELTEYATKPKYLITDSHLQNTISDTLSYQYEPMMNTKSWQLWKKSN